MWRSQMQQVRMALSAVGNTKAISGETGDNIRSYITEIHTPLMQAIMQMLEEYEMRVALYVDGYSGINDSAFAELTQDRLENQQQLLQNELNQFQTVSGEISRILSSVSDIVNVTVPQTELTNTYFTAMGTKVVELNTNTGEYEESHKMDSQPVDEMLDTMQSIISARYGVGVMASNYSPGSYIMMPIYSTLKNQISASEQYTEKNITLYRQNEQKKIVKELREEYPELTEDQLVEIAKTINSTIADFGVNYSQELLQTALEETLKTMGITAATVTKIAGEWAIKAGGTMGPVAENSFVILNSELARNGSTLIGQGVKIGKVLENAGKIIGPVASIGAIALGTYADVENGKTVGQGIAHNTVVVGSGVAVTAVAGLLLSNPGGWVILATAAVGVGVSMGVEALYQNNVFGLQEKLDALPEAISDWFSDRFADIGEAFSF